MDSFKAQDIPGRRTQVDQLLSLFGYSPNAAVCDLGYQAIVLYGRSGTGKSLVVGSILKDLQLPNCWVNCLEAYTPRLLYHMILKALHSQVNSSCADIETCQLKSANFYSFLKSLSELCADHLQGTLYIVLENADKLLQMDNNVVSGLVRMREFTKMDVTLIILSELASGWACFPDPIVFTSPMLHFPEYTYGELIDILSLHRPQDCSKEFYANYVKLLLRVFSLVTRSTRELLHMAKLNFQEYCRPIRMGEATENDAHKLWRNIEPHLKRALDTVYLRTVSSSHWEKMASLETDPSAADRRSAIPKYPMAMIELPFYSKFLLIAAYLASYNPPKTDKKFFVKNQGKKAKKKAVHSQKEQPNCHLTGPKSFPLERLLAIFYAIVEDKVIPSMTILSQISSLVSARLLVCISKKDVLTNPKYKCLASLDCVRSVGKTVNFDVVKYLNDFS